MNQPLDRLDIEHCVARLPKVIRETMERRGPKIFLAGGYIRARIRGERVNDIDLFTRDRDTAQELIDEIHWHDGDRDYIETDNAFTTWRGGYAVQIIHRWTFELPAQCIGSFDFSIARAAIWFESKWSGVADPRFYRDVAARRLIYLDPVGNDAGGSFLRLMKFVRRGYTASPETIARIVALTLRPTRSVEAPDPLADEDVHDDLAAEPMRSGPFPTSGEDLDRQIDQAFNAAMSEEPEDLAGPGPVPTDGPDEIESRFLDRLREVDPRARGF